MKKSMIAFLALAILFTYSSVFGATVERIMKLGFPQEDAERLALSTRLTDEKKIVPPKESMPKYKWISAALWEGHANVKRDFALTWPGNENFQFQAEIHDSGEFRLYRIMNIVVKVDQFKKPILDKTGKPMTETREMIFRIGALPIQKKVQVLEKILEKKVAQQKQAQTATVDVNSISLKSPKSVDVQPSPMKKEVSKVPSPPVQKTEGNGVEKLHEGIVLPISLQTLSEEPMTAIMIPIYQSPWIGDGLGMYSVTEKNGKEVQEFLVRKVWRSYVGSEIYPAVITKFGTYIFVIMQGKLKTDAFEKDVIIVSGSGKYALTLSGRVVEFDLKRFEEEDGKYRSTFFEENPSKVERKMLIDISPNTENGKQFIANLKKIFPHEHYVDGKRISSSEIDPEKIKGLSGKSNGSNYIRRAIERGGLPNINPISVACPPYELGRMLLVWTIAAFDDSLSGNFFEAKVSGYQAAQALSPYLAECQEEMNYLMNLRRTQ